MNKSLIAKVLAVGGIAIALLVPLAMIQLTIAERAGYREQAVRSVQASLAGPQTVTVPFVVWHYREDWEEQVYNKDAKRDETVKRSADSRRLTFARSASVTATVDVRNDHYRGLHRIRTYEAASTMRLTIAVPARALVRPSKTRGQISWAAPQLVLPLTDVRGLRGTPSLKVNGVAIPFEQGLEVNGVGAHIAASLPPSIEASTLTVEIVASFAGMESLAFAPSGDSNDLQLHSSWPHPSFGGRFLPATRSITDSGFSARWDVSSLAAATQVQIQSGTTHRPLDAFAVDFVEPVNVYLLAERATKYGVLFVTLVLASVFVLDVKQRLGIHAMQYGLVGLALAIFFLLLLALSEHIDFTLAYVTAAAACTGLIAVYMGYALKSAARSAAFAGALAVVYGAIYVILIAEQLALLMGALLLFAVLATVMIATRRLDWSRTSVRSEPLPTKS
jgi:inner membrane protein